MDFLLSLVWMFINIMFIVAPYAYYKGIKNGMRIEKDRRQEKIRKRRVLSLTL